MNALGDRGAHIGSVLRYFQPNTLVKRSMDLPRFHLGLSSALYFNGFDGFSNAVHDQPFNEKPLTNVVLLYAWETECESREPFPWTLLNPIPIAQSFSRLSVYTVQPSNPHSAVLHVMIKVVKEKSIQHSLMHSSLGGGEWGDWDLTICHGV